MLDDKFAFDLNEMELIMVLKNTLIMLLKILLGHQDMMTNKNYTIWRLIYG
jgi:hypothetical protein